MTDRTPYLYTSKEFDEVTKLYYYGARYYDPRTSVWQSADPILGKYLPSGDLDSATDLPGMGGIFRSVNGSVYSYAGLNPLILSDPDGEKLIKVVPGKGSAFTRSFLVDESFLPVVVVMNEEAKARGIGIQVNSGPRPADKKVNKVPKGAKAVPPNKTGKAPTKGSKHWIGRALDVNLIDKNGKKIMAADMLKDKSGKRNISDNIKSFIDSVKSYKFGSSIDKSSRIRWGGDFRSQDDPVHYDSPTSPSMYKKLYKENQKQLNNMKDIETIKID